MGNETFLLRGTRILLMGGVVLLALLLFNLQSRLERLGTPERSNPLWITSQLQFELLRLERDILAFRVGRAGADELLLRYEIAWSRIGVMKEGETAWRLVNYGIDVSMIADLRREFEALEPEMVGLTEASLTGAERETLAERLYETFVPYSASVRKMSLDILAARSRQERLDQAALVQISNRLNLMAVLMVVLSVLHLMLMLRDLSRSRELSAQLAAAITDA
ncbi:MAG: hypothetical protein HUJ27_17375 [Rhodobacteraceae bacterium]|nr:hypothetical protein [Paracoccaceae bacterium]